MADQGREFGLLEEVLTIRMHTKVTKGGRNLSFGALVAVGDGKGRVAIGYGKAPGVPLAIEKGNLKARRAMLSVPVIGDTVCHEQIGRYKASRVFMKPAAPGTGVKAGATVRAILTVLGVRNVLTKSLGNNNPVNLARAAMDALSQMRSVEEVERLRGVRVTLRHPQWTPRRTARAEGATPAAEQPSGSPKG